MKKKWLNILILFFFSVIIFCRTGWQGIINIVDTGFPLYPVKFLFSSLYLWDVRIDFGSFNYLGTLLLPLQFFKAFLSVMSISVYLANKLWFILTVFSLGLSIYFLAYVLFPDPKYRFPRLISSLFFILNPHIIAKIYVGHIYNLYEHASGIIVLAILFKVFRELKFQNKYAILIGIFSIFNGLVIRILITTVFLTYLVWILRRKEILFKCIPFLVKTVGIVFLTNLFWIIPVFISLRMGGVVEHNFPQDVDLGVLNFTRPFTSIFWASRLLYGYMPDETHYQHFQQSVYGALAGFGLIILIYSTLFFMDRRKDKLFFIILAILATFFSTGIHYNYFGKIYRWLWDNFSYFHIFRDPTKFHYILVMIYSCLLCFSLGDISAFIDKRRLKPAAAGPAATRPAAIIYVVVLFLIMANAWTLLIGRPMQVVKSVKIPQGYYDLKEYLKKDTRDFRILSLPIKPWYANYNWAPYCMINILPDILPKPVILKMPGFELEDLTDILYKKFYGEHQDVSWMLYGLANVDGIVFQHDMVIDKGEKKRLKDKLDFYVDKDYLNSKEFGELTYYDIENRYFLPLIYTESPPLIKSDSISALEHLNFIKLFVSGDYLNIPGDAVNIFTKEGNFFITQDGYYTIKGSVKPILLRKKLNKIDIKWENKRFKANNTVYRTIYGRNFLVFSIYLNGNSKEDEYMQIELDGLQINLKDNPWFSLVYKVKDPFVQTVEVVLGLDFNKDDIVDGYLKGIYPRPASKRIGEFNYNALEKARQIHPDKEFYDVIKVELYPHKLWGVDCAGYRKGNYNFWIKDFYFYNNSSSEYVLNDNKQLVPIEGFRFYKPVFGIDDENILIDKVLDNADPIILEKDIFLKEGNHRLMQIKDIGYEIDWMILYPHLNAELKSPAVCYEKINNTKYLVKISNIAGPFWLVFSEAFHKGWMAYIRDNGEEQKNHYQVNGFANAWYIARNQKPETRKQNNELDIIIEFMPQRWYRVGLWVSGITILVCIFYILKKR